MALWGSLFDIAVIGVCCDVIYLQGWVQALCYSTTMVRTVSGVSSRSKLRHWFFHLIDSTFPFFMSVRVLMGAQLIWLIITLSASSRSCLLTSLDSTSRFLHVSLVKNCPWNWLILSPVSVAHCEPCLDTAIICIELVMVRSASLSMMFHNLFVLCWVVISPSSCNNSFSFMTIWSKTWSDKLFSRKSIGILVSWATGCPNWLLHSSRNRVSSHW